MSDSTSRFKLGTKALFSFSFASLNSCCVRTYSFSQPDLIGVFFVIRLPLLSQRNNGTRMLLFNSFNFVFSSFRTQISPNSFALHVADKTERKISVSLLPTLAGRPSCWNREDAVPVSTDGVARTSLYLSSFLSVDASAVASSASTDEVESTC